jgi:putative transposase
LAECREIYKWFGVERRRATIQNWYQGYPAYHNQDFTVESDRIAVDERQIQLENEEKAWLYAAIDVDTKVVLHVQISQHRGRYPAEQFLSELKEKLVDGMRYLTTLAQTNLSGDLNYSDRKIVEKLFQTFTMKIDRFHEIWNDSQSSIEHWLTIYTAYYNHHRSHQSFDNQPSVEALRQESSI